MSYDISLIDRKTGKSCTMPKQKIRGGTVPAEYDEMTGCMFQIPQNTCDINITYNYSTYYHEATDGDKRFAYEEKYHEMEEIEYGIRGLYEKTAKESIPMLHDMISKISSLYKDKNGNWKTSKHIKHRYFYKDGRECKDVIYAMFFEKVELTKLDEEYKISEGDTSDYWEETAANAIIPLMDMLNMALFNADNPDAVWDGD